MVLLALAIGVVAAVVLSRSGPRAPELDPASRAFRYAGSAGLLALCAAAAMQGAAVAAGIAGASGVALAPWAMAVWRPIARRVGSSVVMPLRDATE